jgi:hypothetical protein
LIEELDRKSEIRNLESKMNMGCEFTEITYVDITVLDDFSEKNKFVQ